MNRFSILQDKKQCYVCGTTQNINIHEVYFGKNRQNSIKWGCCVYLCSKHHNQSNDGVHFNKELDNHLKQVMEQQFLKHYDKTIEDFISIFKKNYL
jgi:hypothetical protein